MDRLCLTVDDVTRIINLAVEGNLIWTCVKHVSGQW